MKLQIFKLLKVSLSDIIIGGCMMMFPLVGYSQPPASTWAAPPNADNMSNPYGVDETVIAAGKDLFATSCANCHGKRGRGDGPKAEELDKTPGDLTAAAFRTQTDGAIFWKIAEGNKPMPSFKSELTEEQRWMIVTYIRELGKKAE